MYVNMHELASMAASKAQEMNLPPPPPEFTSAQQPTAAVPEGEKDGSTSESSLESSSGYGSQTTFPAEEANAHAEGIYTQSWILGVFSFVLDILIVSFCSNSTLG